MHAATDDAMNMIAQRDTRHVDVKQSCKHHTIAVSMSVISY